MSEAKEIEVTIDQEGNIEVEMFGYHGKGCHEILQRISAALGRSVKVSKKPDFYKPVQKEKIKVVRGM